MPRNSQTTPRSRSRVPRAAESDEPDYVPECPNRDVFERSARLLLDKETPDEAQLKALLARS